MEKYKKIKNRYRAFLYLFILTMAFSTMHAQVNHVLNPSFEQYSRCPNSLDEIKFANFWTTIDSSVYPPVDSFGNDICTPDYCNECATNYDASVPVNLKFYHYPRTGKGMAQVVMFYDEITPFGNARDYLQGKLDHPLINGQSYYVTFFVSMEQASTYAVNSIGAYLDNGSIDTAKSCGFPQTSYIPQIIESEIINDTLNWVKVEGSFVANGTEKYITIGNFHDKAHTLYEASISGGNNGRFAFYLVDDVNVVECDIPAYAGGTFYKAKSDSVFIGRNEIVPDCMWYRNGVLIDTVRAGFWAKDTINTMYVVKQTICGNIKYDTAQIIIANESVSNVGPESIYKIYPNPAQHEINIRAPNNSSAAMLVIYDLSGRVMMKQEVHFLNGNLREPLNLPGGVYVIRLTDENARESIHRLSVL